MERILKINNNTFHLTSFKKIEKVVKTLSIDFIYFSNDILLKQNLFHITL